MRALGRGLGLLLAAGAFVAVVVDATRSIADGAFRLTSLGAAWAAVDPDAAARAGRLASDLVAVPARAVLGLPLAAVLVGLAALLLWLGRRPRPRIGHALR